MPTLTIDNHLGAHDVATALRADVRRGLTGTPKVLPPKWFYDERGSVLYDEITRLPEYYPFRREREILQRRAFDIAVRTGADTLIELGSGTSEKTRLLVDAMRAAGNLRRYVPFDVSREILLASAEEVASEYEGVSVHAVIGDFERHLPLLPAGGRRLVAFLGGTIGNMEPEARHRFFTELHRGLAPGDALLLGTDLVKDPARLVPAYDDAAGVTAEFNRNVLHVINRELDADFDVDRFRHVAVWDDVNEWIEMRLRSLDDTVVTVGELGLVVPFRRGEEMRTEISAKFRLARVVAELDAAGFSLDGWFTDARGDYGLSVSFVR